MEIKFSKQALEDLEKELELKELQEFLDNFERMAEDGSLLENSEPVDLERMKIEQPNLYEKLIIAIDELDNEDKLN